MNNLEDLDIHRRIDIARSRVILAARSVVIRWKVHPNDLRAALQECAESIYDLDKVQAEWKEPLDKSPNCGD